MLRKYVGNTVRKSPMVVAKPTPTPAPKVVVEVIEEKKPKRKSRRKPKPSAEEVVNAEETNPDNIGLDQEEDGLCDSSPKCNTEPTTNG